MISFISDKEQKLVKAVLSRNDNISYSAMMKLLRTRQVKVNSARVNEDVFLKQGDRVDVYYSSAERVLYGEIYSDENVIVVDKKSGCDSVEVFEKLKSEYGEVYFVHRLDRNTSGVMIFSRNKLSESALLNGFKKRDFVKIYRALVFGRMKEKSAVLVAYLVKDAENSFVKIYDSQVRDSVPIKTGYKVIEEYENGTSLLDVELYTGKTHQIRAHLAHEGHFVVGDGKYGDNDFNRSLGVKSQMLKAVRLTLRFSGGVLKYLDGKTFTAVSEDFPKGEKQLQVTE